MHSENRLGSVMYRAPYGTFINFVQKPSFCQQNCVKNNKMVILLDKIIFCLTKLYFVRQNNILLDKIIFC